MPTKSARIHSLTSLRFFAALYVVILHTLPLGLSQKLPVFLVRFVSLGYISVSFFFFLSGYILALVYLSGNRTVNIRNFFVARFARIYPIFVVCLVLDFPRLVTVRAARVGMHTAVMKTVVTFLCHLVMLQAWTKYLLYSLDPPAWSLSAETFFYLIFPLIGALLWSIPERKLPWVAALLYLTGQLVVLLASLRLSSELICFLPVFHLSTFLLGIVFYRWQIALPSPSRCAANVLLFLSVAGLSLVTAALPYIPRFMNNLRDGILAPLFAMAILALAGTETFIAKFLGNRLLVLLGEASFSLYLLHLVLHYFYKSWIPNPGATNYIAFVVICILLSVLSFVTIETPARSLISNLLKTRPRETMELATDASA